MCLPGSATIPATHADRLRAAQESGRQIVRLLESGITARQIINSEGIENGIRVSTAIGGSTNVALHIPAIGYEADCEISMDLLEELCRSTPHIAKMNPAAAPNRRQSGLPLGRPDRAALERHTPRAAATGARGWTAPWHSDPSRSTI